MKTFFAILQKHMNSKTVIYPAQSGIGRSEYWYHILNCEREIVQNYNYCIFSFYMFIDRVFQAIFNEDDISEWIYEKYRNFYQILDNTFMLDHHKANALELFCKTQRTYWAFSRLARIFKIRRAKLQVSCDMYMTPIDPVKTRAILIYQRGANYLFKLSDLINIIHNALSNSPYHFADPIFPKNPYTNIRFSIGAMYEIYYQIRHSDYKMPVLLNAFFQESFDLKRFVYNHEAIIRDVYLEDYVKKTPANELYLETLFMIKIFNRPKRLRIHNEFPKDRLVDIMRPYLRLYLIHEYSISDTSKRSESYEVLREKMNKFIEYNPQFGRKIMKRSSGSSSFHIDFNDKHVDFQHASVQTFSVLNNDSEYEESENESREDELEVDDN